MECTVCTTYFKKPGAPESTLVRSCRRQEIHLEEFGTENKHETFLKTKLLPLAEFLKGVTTPHVMFVDGNDTLILSSLDAMFRTYEKIAAGRVVIGSELCVWPYKQKRGILERRAREHGARSRYMFIDTGLIMGPTLGVRETLQILIESVEKYRAECRGYSRRVIEDDVGLMVLNICDGTVDPIIDYGCQMICALRNLEDSHYVARPGDLHCLETHSHPHIVHCNGHRYKDRRRLSRVFSILGSETWSAQKLPKEGYHK